MEVKNLGRTDKKVAAIGQGTWLFVGSAPDREHDRKAVESLRAGIDLGMTLIDTAEQYGYGHAEEIVGEAVKGQRDRVFVASKVSPENFAYEDALKAASGSLKRLRTDYVDLYQLHRPSPYIPIADTMRAMRMLVDAGSVKFIGVSNFSVRQLRQAEEALAGYPIVSNQVKYHPLDRNIESELLPYAVKHGISIIAYSPFAHGRLFTYSGKEIEFLRRLARRYEKTLAQVCLNWLIEKNSVIAIPKAFQIQHVKENAAAVGWKMEPQDYELIDRVLV